MAWLINNASTLIAAGAALSGAFVAAVITYINNLQNIKAAQAQRKEQYQFEKWKANRQVYIEKGEETIGLISSLLNYFVGVVNTTTLDIVTSKTGNISDEVKSRLTDARYSDEINRIDTLVVSYFPELMEYKDRMLTQFQQGISIYMQVRMGEKKRDEAAMELMEVQAKLNLRAKEFKLKVSKVISTHL